jgi:superfamily II DNA or RNA helicase
MRKKELKATIEKMADLGNDQKRLLIATGKFIGEGFDDSRLDTLFLAHPISWKGTLQQYAGRLHRNNEGKSVVRIYDYVDNRVPVLQRMHQRRITGCRSMGYEITTPNAGERTDKLIYEKIS